MTNDIRILQHLKSPVEPFLIISLVNVLCSINGAQFHARGLVDLSTFCCLSIRCDQRLHALCWSNTFYRRSIYRTLAIFETFILLLLVFSQFLMCVKSRLNNKLVWQDFLNRNFRCLVHKVLSKRTTVLVVIKSAYKNLYGNALWLQALEIIRITSLKIFSMEQSVTKSWEV